MADPNRIYRWFLRLYPARFREEYGTPLERQFVDEYREIQGTWPRAMFWIGAVTDLAISIPTEILHELCQDVGYAVRVYRRRSLSTGLALMALALAIGATTGVFSVVNALLIRSLPFRDPQRLVELQGFQLATPGAADFDAWRGGASYLTDATLYRTEQMNLSTDHEALRVEVAETSANFFQMLGGDPETGRPFAAGEDGAGRDNVAVIGYGLWQQFFGGDPRVLGSTIHLNGGPLTVVGVAPPGFDYPSKAAVWTPTIFDHARLARARAITWTAIGRLKPGLTLGTAGSLYRASQTRLAGVTLRRGETDRLKLISMRDLLAGDVRKASMVLLGIVVFVLLTACANIAHLLLSRITERHQELVLRAALGASRSRLVQQLITESTVLTLAAAAAGLAVALWASRLAASAQPALLAAQEYTILDWRVLGFAVGVAALTGLVFGVIPASLIGRMQPGVDPLRSQPGAHDTGVRRMRAVLIAMQSALTLILVAGSLSMGRSFLKVLGVDRGFRTDHVVTMSVALSGTPRQREPGPYYQETLERLRAVPGVESAGAVEFLPLATNSFMGLDFELDGSRLPQMGLIVTATPDYLRTMSTELLRGRDFTPAEAQGFQPVAIVNEAFARQFGNGIELVGKSMTSLLRKEPVTIVGVTRNVRYFGPTDTGAPQVFLPAGAHPPLNMTFVAKVRGKTEAYLPICRAAIQPVDLKVPVFNVETFDQRLADSLARPRFYTTAVSFFGIFAWLLALLGVYGVASFSIAQRRHEIGVRLAVGASPERLRKMLLRQSLLPVAVGAAIGVAGAIAMGQLVEHLMEGAGAIGIATCVGAAIMVSATASAAIWTATRRIAGMDPMRVLRTD